MASSYAAHVCLAVAGAQQVQQLRERAFQLLLALEHPSTAVSTLRGVQSALGPALGRVCQLSTQFAAGVSVALASCWPLALALTRIHALQRLAAEPRVCSQYATRLRLAEQTRLARCRGQAALGGAFAACLWVLGALILWLGGVLVANGSTTPRQAVQAFMGVLLGAQAPSRLPCSLHAVRGAQTAAGALSRLLETRMPALQMSELPVTCVGALEFVDVRVSHGAQVVLRGCSLRVAAGERVAVLGARGSGKSTLTALLTRLCVPSHGLVLLDGRELQSLAPDWLRAQLGLVTQSPTLFTGSVFHNLALGLVARRQLALDGAEAQYDDRERVETAARRAGVHSFILSLSEGYETLVDGLQLPQLQRQRLALARALVRGPKLLVLDELLDVTLDDALRASEATALLLSRHVSSAVLQMDQVAVLEAGRVLEFGTPGELLQRPDSAFHRLHGVHTGLDARGDFSEPEQPPVRWQRAPSRPTPPCKACKPPVCLSVAVLELSRPERKFLVAGLLDTVLDAMAVPLAAVLASKPLAGLAGSEARELRATAAVSDLWCVAAAVAAGLVRSLRRLCLGVATERAATRLRELHFRWLLAQPLVFFDVYSPPHDRERLAQELARQATKTALLAADVPAHLLQTLATTAITATLTFSLGRWMLALVLLSAFPLLLFAVSARVRHQELCEAWEGSQTQQEIDKPAEACAEKALRHRQAVVELGLERVWCRRFRALQQHALQLHRRDTQCQTRVHALGVAAPLLVTALAVWLAGELAARGDASFPGLATALLVVLLCSQSLGRSVACLSDVGTSLEAATAIFALRDAVVKPRAALVPAIDATAAWPTSPTPTGGVEFRGVRFSYPTRSEQPVLPCLSFSLQAGETVALCGQSGSGKSTVMLLLQRCYELQDGVVLLDGVDARQLDLRRLRSCVSYVGREPTLFSGFIAQNIALAVTGTPSPEAVAAAAQVAHAHGFISQLPEGYSAQVASLESLNGLSRDQQQRIALARAVLQDARLLLLDDPAGSLDGAEERAVQQTLGTVVARRVQRTTVIAASSGVRSPTVRNAGRICVLVAGELVKQGTHEELRRQGGVYARLVQRDSTLSGSTARTSKRQERGRLRVSA